jgi:uncharacterized repeat protein (TIGR01451 family)
VAYCCLHFIIFKFFSQMKKPLLKPALRRWGRFISLSLSLLFITSYTLQASSHREAPLIANDPLADNVDVYAFRSPDDPSTVTLIATYVPMQLPQGGPNYYNFGENVRYEIHIDNDASNPGDEITYRFTFTQVNEDPTTFFNIRLGAQNLKMTYTLERSTDGGNTFTTIISNGVVPPTNIGARSIDSDLGLGMPYADVMANAIMTASSGETVYCGPADDPFYVDLGGVFDLGNLPRQNGGRSLDGLACLNVSTIAIRVPIATLLKSGAAATPANILDPDYVIGVWASASRPQMLTFGNGQVTGSGQWVQVSRLGMPLTNEAVIPIGQKDFWNSITPYDEITETNLDEYFYNPELGLYMDDALFGGAVPAFAPLRIQRNSLGAFDFGNGNDGLYGLKGSPAVAGTALDDAVFGTLLLPAPGKPRSVDLWPIFHTGVPNVRPYQLATGKNGDPLAAGKPFINNFLPNGGDMLRLNMAVPVTPRNDPNFSPLGIIQAAVLGLTDPAYNTTTDLQFIPNMDGFPNGRRLEDDVTLIELQAVSGAALAAIGLWYDDYDPASSPSPVTQDLLDVLTYRTGVNANDRGFSTAFPYVAMPWAGDSGCGGNDFSTRAIDLELAITANKTSVGIYENVTYSVTLVNRGPATATGIRVAAGLPVGMVHTGNVASLGSYNLFFEAWEIPMLEVGETATLSLTLFTLVDNVDITNFVQVIAASQTDIDSAPGNNTGTVPNEDDEASVTVTVNLIPNDPDASKLGSPSLFSNVYPQPAANSITFELQLENDLNTDVQIIDAAGNVLQTRQQNLNAGFNKIQFDISSLPAGMYFVRVDGLNTDTAKKRFVVVR